MAIIRCKMCGGDLLLQPDTTTAQCEYCGSLQTVPLVEQEKKLNLFTRANRLRFGCEFDKAFGVYETIVGEYPEEPEAYWGLVLCKYGIEYVDDPLTAKKIPTCHRSSFQSVLEDDNYQLALQYADVAAQKLYRQEAEHIERLRREIQELSAREKPYDIFICYKETAPGTNERTLDSVLAQDLYDTLTAKCYRVFFSRVTLEDKVGQAYEPYIFAALHSAKIMLVVGTDYEHFHAVWVKNEWHRYLLLMHEDRDKYLIPCYKDIEIEDMPKEFRRLQAQDLGKVGAVQDLLRGIEKLLPKGKQGTGTVRKMDSAVATLLERGQIALEDRLWNMAEGCFSKLLDQDPQNAEGYIGMLLAQEHRRNLDALTEKWLEDYCEVTPINMAPENVQKRFKPGDFPEAAENYLNRKAVEALYCFPETYISEIAAWEEQYRQAKRRWEHHPLLSRAEEFADEVTDSRLQGAKARFLEEMSMRLEAAKAKFQEQEEQQRRDYEARLQDANKAAAELYNRAHELLRAQYKRLEVEAETEQDPYTLSGMARDLEQMGDYKNAVMLARQCRERSKQRREEKERRIAEERAKHESRQLELLQKELKWRRNLKIVAVAVAALIVLLIGLAVAWRPMRLRSALNNKTFTYEMAKERGWCSEGDDSFIAADSSVNMVAEQLGDYYKEGDDLSSLQLLIELPAEFYHGDIQMVGSNQYMEWLKRGLLYYGEDIRYSNTDPESEVWPEETIRCTIPSVTGEKTTVYCVTTSYMYSDTTYISIMSADAYGAMSVTGTFKQEGDLPGMAILGERPEEIILPYLD